MKVLLKYFKPYKKKTIIGFTAKMSEAVLELALPLFMGKIIDIGIVNRDIPYIMKMALIMFGVIIVGLGCASVCQYYASMACQGLGNDLRQALVSKIEKFSYKELDKIGNSTLINRLTYDVNQVIQAFAMLIRLVSRGPLICIGSMIMAIYIAPKLSWIFAVLIPIFAIVMIIIMKVTVPLYKDTQVKMDTLGKVLKENMTGVRVIRAFARHHQEKNRMDDATAQLSDAYIRVSNISALLNPITMLIMNAGIILLFYLGGQNVYTGSMSQGDIVVLINYITQVLYAMTVIANLVILFTKAYTSSQRITEVLITEESIVDGELTVVDDNENSIKFNNVDFQYLSKDTISNLSFDIKKGETFGIVGTTGSGKSTIINLMMRFYDTSSGQVELNGKDVKKYSQKTLRSQFGLVPQQSVLFSGSIKENIKWGKPDANDEEVIEALKVAQAYDFVRKLEHGMDSKIEEGGKNFSGGQRQRLTIARAVVNKPPIIILDDSLSALDYQTDLKLRQSLKEYLSGSTVIIVSQRISSVLEADNILVLDDGERVGFGKHNMLLESCETYREIYETQSKSETEGA